MCRVSSLPNYFLTSLFSLPLSMDLGVPQEGGPRNRFFNVYQASHIINNQGQVAANNWYLDLFTGFWNRATFLGEFTSTSPEEISKELEPYGQTYVLIFNDERLSRSLAKHPMFKKINSVDSSSKTTAIYVFMFRHINRIKE